MGKKLFLLLMIVLFSYSFAYGVELKIAFEDKEQPPYYIGNSSDVMATNPGVAVEMVLMVGDMLDDVQIKLLRMPWKRCTTMLEQNKVDGIFNASYKTSRLMAGWYPTVDKTHEGEVDPSRRITTIAYSLYAMKGKNLGWTGSNFDILKGTVGAPLGYSIVDDLRKKGVSVEEAPSTEMNLKKLVNGRVLAVALQDVTGDSIISSKPEEFGNIEKLSPPLKTKPYYLMLSKNFVSSHPELSQKIWDTIALIRETKLKDIAKKY